MPPMLRSAVKPLVAGQPDMAVVGEIDKPFGVLLAVGQTHADVVILCLKNAELPGICSHLLSEYPHIKILGISVDARHAVLYEHRAQMIPIGNVSPEALLDTIRAAVRGDEISS
jgi:DNA-binding NarL/FixJ family response regulator